jgi:hypothetical protein
MVLHATLGNQLAVAGIKANTVEGQHIRDKLGARIQAAKLGEFSTLGVVLGYSYNQSPVVIPDGTPAVKLLCGILSCLPKLFNLPNPLLACNIRLVLRLFDPTIMWLGGAKKCRPRIPCCCAR